MADLKFPDLIGMLHTSNEIARLRSSDIATVQIVDEMGDIYDIQDVKFEPSTRTITILFDHDH